MRTPAKTTNLGRRLARLAIPISALFIVSACMTTRYYMAAQDQHIYCLTKGNEGTTAYIECSKAFWYDIEHRDDPWYPYSTTYDQDFDSSQDTEETTDTAGGGGNGNGE